MERDEPAKVQVHVAAVAALLQRANHGEANPSEQNRVADGRASWKQGAPDLIADDDHGALLRVVHGIDPAALVDWQIADLIKVRGHTHDLAAGLEEIADRPDVAAGDGGSRSPHAGTFGQNVLIVAVREIVLPQWGEAAWHHGGPARRDEHHVLAEGIELFAIASAKPFSQTNEQQQRTDAPGN